MRVSLFRKWTGQGFISLLYNNIYIMQKYARHCFPYIDITEGEREKHEIPDRAFLVEITGNPIK